MKYHISNLKGTNTALHVPTLELAQEVDKILIAAGGRSMSQHWHVYKEKTCFYLKDFPLNSYSSMNFFEKKSEIITAQEFINHNREMKYKVGDKVVPISKSVWRSLKDSAVWNKAKSQGYMYVTEIGVNSVEGTINYVCNDLNSKEEAGDYFIESDLIPYESPFKLPEKWAIKVVKGGEKTNPEVYKWRDSYFINKGYIHSDKWYSPKIQKGYTEITLEQFKKHVLKQSDMKEIIGYKLKNDCKQYEEAALKLINNKTLSFTELGGATDGCLFKINSICEQKYKTAGVLDLWFEPVYEENKPEYKVGDWVIGWHSYQKDYSYVPWKIVEIITDHLFPKTGISTNKDCVRKATEEEVKNHLVMMAEAKGFVKGLKLSHVLTFENENFNFVGIIGQDEWEYDSDLDILTYLGVKIYHQGKWATILPQGKVVSISCESGIFDVNVTEEGFNFGAYTVKVHEIESLLEEKAVCVWTAKANTFTVGCKVGIPRKDLEALVMVHKEL